MLMIYLTYQIIRSLKTISKLLKLLPNKTAKYHSYMSMLFVNNVNLKTDVWQKPTFSGVYTYFDSILPDTYKIGMIYTLLNTFLDMVNILFAIDTPKENISEE